MCEKEKSPARALIRRGKAAAAWMPHNSRSGSRLLLVPVERGQGRQRMGAGRRRVGTDELGFSLYIRTNMLVGRAAGKQNSGGWILGLPLEKTVALGSLMDRLDK